MVCWRGDLPALPVTHSSAWTARRGLRGRRTLFAELVCLVCLSGSCRRGSGGQRHADGVVGGRDWRWFGWWCGLGLGRCGTFEQRELAVEAVFRAAFQLVRSAFARRITPRGIGNPGALDARNGWHHLLGAHGGR